MSHRALVPERSCDGDHPPDAPVVHTHGSIALVVSGSGIMHMHSAWTVGPGDVFLVPEGAPHYRRDDVPTDYIGLRVCMACLPDDRWGPPLRQLFHAIDTGACPVLRLGESERDELAHTLRALGTGQDTQEDWVVDARMGLLTALLRSATPTAPLQQRGETPLVAQALGWIARHGTEPISLVDVARAVGRAPSHVATRVKEETGHTVGDWVMNARMAHARDLLLRSDASVEEVAQRVGYRSASHFHRTFRRVHEVPPARWREQHRRAASPHRAPES